MKVFALVTLLYHLTAICNGRLIGSSRAIDESQYSEIVLPQYGKLRGIVEKGNSNNEITSFFGIPYAEKPVGDLRWREPVDKLAWESTIDATNRTFEPCPQIQQKVNSTDPIGSEDCLKLNVWTPTNRFRNNSLPVLFWIHGGAYTDGMISEFLASEFNGKNIVERSGHSVVVVAIQYRLNILGFMGSSLIRNRTRDKSTGNFGLQDQRSEFGGDPTKVFIFGESAGAGSISNHLVMKKSWPYFQSVGLESGSFSYWITQSMESAERQFKALIKETKCPDITCLIKLPVSRLLKDAYKVMQRLKILHPEEHCDFAPTVDGVELGDFPWELLRAKKFKHVPVLQGFNHDEGTMDVAKFGIRPGIDSVEADVVLRILGLNHSQINEFNELYPIGTKNGQFKSRYWQLTALLGDYNMACPTIRSAKIMSEAMANSESVSKQSSKVFVYEFTHVPSFKPPNWAGYHSHNAGVYHSAEIPFVFNDKKFVDPHDNHHISLSKAEDKLSDAMSTAWIHFATYQKPTHEKIFWPNFRDNSETWIAVLDFPFPYIHKSKRNRAKRCSFVESIGRLIPKNNFRGNKQMNLGENYLTKQVSE